MRLSFQVILGLILILAFSSCGSDTEKKLPPKFDAQSQKELTLTWVRLDSIFINAKGEENWKQLLDRFPAFEKQYLPLPQGSTRAQYIPRLNAHFGNPGLKSFYQYNDSVFNGYSAERKTLNQMFSAIQVVYPETKLPTIYPLVTGFTFDKDLSVSDTAIFISMDYFLGPEAPYRPDQYEYMLRRYDRPYLIPMLSWALAQNRLTVNHEDNTLLANMIDFGKVHFFTEQILPELPDSLNIMYTNKELAGVEENVEFIWQHFIEKKLLYETNNKVIEKFVDEAPFVTEISQKCPGRIGRYLGWQIVRAYMERNPKVTLKELMAETDYQKILKLSAYKPQNQKP